MKVYRYVLRIRNNAFRNNEIDDMGICVMSDDFTHIQAEIEKIVYCGNIDFHVEINEIEERY